MELFGDLRVVGVLRSHVVREKDRAALAEFRAALGEYGIGVRLFDEGELAGANSNLDVRGGGNGADFGGKTFGENSGAGGVKVFASIGGDGSYIALCRALAGVRGACVFGIHTGHLGFLTDVNPQDLREFVGELVRGEFERKWLALLGVRICGDFRADFDGANARFLAQNAAQNPAKNGENLRENPAQNATQNGKNSCKNLAQNGGDIAPSVREFAAVNDLVISRQSSQSIITINAFLNETPRQIAPNLAGNGGENDENLAQNCDKNAAPTTSKFEFDVGAAQNHAKFPAQTQRDNAPQTPRDPAQNLTPNPRDNAPQTTRDPAQNFTPNPRDHAPQTPRDPASPAAPQPHAHRTLRHFNTYRGDGLIISTATGSTAYNLSAGGAILHGDVRAFCVTPICSHSLTQRPLVLPTDIALTLRCAGGACVVIDGQQSLSLADGWVEVGFGAGLGVWLIHRKKRDYFSVLKEKLRWGSDD